MKGPICVGGGRLHVGTLIDEMLLTRNEVELAFAYVLGQSLSHREEELRRLLAA
jgi:hypothetical protein